MYSDVIQVNYLRVAAVVVAFNSYVTITQRLNARTFRLTSTATGTFDKKTLKEYLLKIIIVQKRYLHISTILLVATATNTQGTTAIDSLRLFQRLGPL
jgi:hypothetical protein